MIYSATEISAGSTIRQKNKAAAEQPSTAAAFLIKAAVSDNVLKKNLTEIFWKRNIIKKELFRRTALFYWASSYLKNPLSM
jgi:hypothetical protein